MKIQLMVIVYCDLDDDIPRFENYEFVKRNDCVWMGQRCFALLGCSSSGML